LPGVGIFEVLILDPCVRIVDIAVEQVLTVVRIGLEISFLDFVADEFRVARRQLAFDVFQIALLYLLMQLLAPDRLF
jgi:hypothetical protein